MFTHRPAHLGVIVAFIAIATFAPAFAQKSRTPSRHRDATRFDPAARDLLLRMDSATRRLRNVAYDSHYLYHFGAAPVPDTTDTRVIIEQTDTVDPAGARWRVEYPGTSVQAWDGDALRSISYARSMYRVDTSEHIRSTGDLPPAALTAFTARRVGDPDDPDITALRMLGTAVVDGEQCRVVQVVYRGNPEQSITDYRTTWSISTSDYLPRRKVDSAFISAAPLLQDMTLRNIRTNVTTSDTTFAPPAPPGFTVFHAVPYVEPPPLSVGTAAPAWILPGAANTDSLALIDLRGKVVLMDFWYSTCGPCVMAIPDLEKIHKRYAKSGVVVLGVNCFEKPPADPAAFLKRRGATYRTLVGGETIAKDYHVSGYPTLFVIDRSGTIVEIVEGYGKGVHGRISKVIEAALAKKEP